MGRKSEIWIPPLHPKQEVLFRSAANEILYGGATRGGKSHGARVVLTILCSRIDNLQCDIFRLNFDDVIAENMDGKYSFPDLLYQWEKDRLVKINKTEIDFWNGAKISLEHCANDKVTNKHQGIAKHIRVFGEATQIPYLRMKWLRGWVTMDEEMKDKLPEQIGDLLPHLTPEEIRDYLPKIFYLTNPTGQSAGYFRRGFVKAAPKGTYFYAPLIDGGFKRQYIEATVDDNPSENKDATIRRITGATTQANADALLTANWDAPTGDFFRDYNDDIHAVDDFIPPAHWFKFRTFDWGSAEPFSVLWWAVSDGEEFIYNGARRWFPRGALICYREWFGCDEEDHAKGLWLRNEDIAQGILNRTTETTSGITLTDSLPFQDRGDSRDGKKYKIADRFAELGVPLTRANTKRVFGCSEIRGRLIGGDQGPMIYFTRSCKACREYLPSITTDDSNPETCVDKGEASHTVDTIRYACATKPLVKDATKPVDELPPRGQITPKQILSILKKQKVSYGR